MQPYSPFSKADALAAVQVDNSTAKQCDEAIWIRSSGHYVPTHTLSNEDLSKLVDTSDEWIYSRTGIRSRRIARAEETTSFMAIEAAKKALEGSGLSADAIDLVIVASSTPDSAFPAVAALVQGALGLRPIPAFDVQMACSGFIYVLEIATQMLKAKAYKHALIIGVDRMSSLVDWQDRSTCVLFADGAGAVVLSREANTQASADKSCGLRVLGNSLFTDGSLASILKVIPASQTESQGWKPPYIQMQGRELFKWAIRTVGTAVQTALQAHKLQTVDWIIPHQANMRIVETLAEYLEMPLDRFICNLESYGNTSAASIPIALDEALRAKKILPGHTTLLVGFGAGLSWGTTLLG